VKLRGPEAFDAVVEELVEVLADLAAPERLEDGRRGMGRMSCLSRGSDETHPVKWTSVMGSGPAPGFLDVGLRLLALARERRQIHDTFIPEGDGSA
jgi:hypothetical protein